MEDSIDRGMEDVFAIQEEDRSGGCEKLAAELSTG